MSHHNSSPFGQPGVDGDQELLVRESEPPLVEQLCPPRPVRRARTAAAGSARCSVWPTSARHRLPPMELVLNDLIAYRTHWVASRVRITALRRNHPYHPPTIFGAPQIIYMSLGHDQQIDYRRNHAYTPGARKLGQGGGSRTLNWTRSLNASRGHRSPMQLRPLPTKREPRDISGSAPDGLPIDSDTPVARPAQCVGESRHGTACRQRGGLPTVVYSQRAVVYYQHGSSPPQRDPQGSR
jgi:hypothetical protein